MRRIIVLVALSLFVASCGGGEGDSDVGADPASGGTEVLIEFENGEPARDIWRQDVPLGDTVSVVVVGDRDEQIHVHGYDLYVEPGDDADSPLVFDALIPGRFEIELEQSGRLILEITVS